MFMRLYPSLRKISQLFQIISVLERQKHAFTDALIEDSHSPGFVRAEHRPEGHRLIDVRLADGTPLDPQAFYTIVSNETMSRKAAFKNAQDKRVLGPVQPLFFEAVKRLSPLKNDPDNRVEQSK